MTDKTKKRTYSVFSYANAYFWARCPDLKKRISSAIGDQYTETETQIGNINNQLRVLGHTDLHKELKRYYK